MATRILKDENDRRAWVNFLCAQPLPITVSSLKGAQRSKAQNRTFHMWVGQIAAETGQTQGEAKGEVKFAHGRPILERDNSAWLEKWGPLYKPLPYHMQVLAFEAIPVTSEMTTRQLAEMMEAISKQYRSMGIDLIDPEARKYEAEFGRV